MSDYIPLTNLEIALKKVFLSEDCVLSVGQFLHAKNAAFARMVLAVGLTDPEEEEELWNLRKEMIAMVCFPCVPISLFIVLSSGG